MSYRWTICICSIRTRQMFLMAMLANLMPQIMGEVEVLISIDDGDVAIGHKRQKMLDAAQGEFVSWIDDDDQVGPAFVSSLLTAIRSHPEANYFAPACFRSDSGGPVVSWPCPFPGHIGPVRTTLARQVGFPSISAGEDNQYALGLRKLPDLGPGVPVPGATYVYKFRRDRRGEKTHAGTFNAEARVPWKDTPQGAQT